ncbi:hypothetical protein G4177_09140 [Corallococcus sp. ZKHCc1 1396]|uniref:Uncharacterized protein n=1 Tax=Corallococcus soli TaxID=2710757 RepID=A0ABR9PK80_9BACT|nr:hypothetical protein [Corallococcus soli]
MWINMQAGPCLRIVAAILERPAARRASGHHAKNERGVQKRFDSAGGDRYSPPPSTSRSQRVEAKQSGA